MDLEDTYFRRIYTSFDLIDRNKKYTLITTRDLTEFKDGSLRKISLYRKLGVYCWYPNCKLKDTLPITRSTGVLTGEVAELHFYSSSDTPIDVHAESVGDYNVNWWLIPNIVVA